MLVELIRDLLVKGCQPMGTTIVSMTVNATAQTSYNNIGFVPSCVIFVAADSSNPEINVSIGFDNLSAAVCCGIAAASTISFAQPAYSSEVYRSGSNYVIAKVGAWLSNGFRLDSTVVGTCSMTLYALCIP